MIGLGRILNQGTAAFWVASLGLTLLAVGQRNVQPGEVAPEFDVSTMSGHTCSSKSFRGKILIVVYLSAAREDSERATVEAQAVVTALGRNDVKLVFLTADFVQKAYFVNLWEEHSIQAPLGFDSGRKFYKETALVALPTTLVIDKTGRLLRSLTTHDAGYAIALSAFVKHGLGLMDDASLASLLKSHKLDRRITAGLTARHRAAARAATTKKDYDSAEKELRAALRASPNSGPIQLDLADVLIETGRPAEANQILEAVLAKNPRHRRARMLQGIASLKAEDWRNAEIALKEALVLNPEPARTHFYLGRVYELTGRTDEALEQFREAARLLLRKHAEGRFEG